MMDKYGNSGEQVIIHAIDYDKVEPHNIGNQHFSYADVGLRKSTAIQNRFAPGDNRPQGLLCRDIRWRLNDAEYGDYNDWINWSDIFIMAVDKMDVRRSIVNTINNARISQPPVIFDTRLAPEVIQSYSTTALTTENLAYNNDDAPASPCQSRFSADRELVQQAVDWLVENVEHCMEYGTPLFSERQLIGSEVIQW